jgi:kynurenine formamidase
MTIFFSMKLIDLSHTIHNDLSVFPGDSPLRLEQVKYYHQDGYNNFQLSTGMHVGTHLDGPMHLTNSNTFIAELPLESFTGKGIVIDIRDQDILGITEVISSPIKPGDIVLFYSGCDKFFGENGYYTNCPVFDEKLVHYLVEQKVKIIGIDWPSPDQEPYPMHQILLKNNILILENLTNLDLILHEPDIEIFAFPLKINADSSIVRAVARIS